ncbi:MAG: universal stress protein [Planctomycetota bacterium]
MHPLRTILVATDFSLGARSALAEGVRLARSCGASLHVLHVFSNVDADNARSLFSDVAGSVDDLLRSQAGERLSAELSEVGTSPDDVTLHARSGRVVDEMTSVVDEIGADLLVIGATGEGGRRWGTHAGRCVRRGPMRVLLVPPKHEGPYRRIVACVDFSGRTKEVVDHAAGLARQDDARVTSIHCYELPWERASFGMAMPENPLQADEQYQQLLAKQYESEVSLGEGETLPEFSLVRDVDPGRGIVRYATEEGADLVVCGTTGRSQLGYWILGTTAEKVMRDTPSVVLAIKSPKGASDES